MYRYSMTPNSLDADSKNATFGKLISRTQHSSGLFSETVTCVTHATTVRPLSGIDLRGSQLAGMHADTNELQGALVDPFQVAVIASMLGLVVERLPTESLNEYNTDIRYPPAGKTLTY